MPAHSNAVTVRIHPTFTPQWNFSHQSNWYCADIALYRAYQSIQRGPSGWLGIFHARGHGVLSDQLVADAYLRIVVLAYFRLFKLASRDDRALHKLSFVRVPSQRPQICATNVTISSFSNRADQKASDRRLGRVTPTERLGRTNGRVRAL